MIKIIVRIGSMYYNKDKDYVARVTKRTHKEVVYEWRRLDGKTMEEFPFPLELKSTVPLGIFVQCILDNLLQELSPLEKELL